MTLFRYDVTWQRAHVVALLGGLAVGMAALVGRWAERPLGLGRALPVMPQRVAAARELINPNTAPVGSLRRLSGIGPVRAAAIAEYAAMKRGVAFGCAEDLTAVGGIGQGMAERLRPCLVFAPSGE